GLPDDASVRAIRADPTRRGLLYAGTDTGVFVSFADGASWRRLGGNLPVVPVHDLAVKGTDLVAATHGRSFWILDDLTPLRQLAAGADLASPFLCPRRDTYRFTSSGGHDAPAPGLSYQPAGGVTVAREGRRTSTGDTHVRYLDAGANPPDGVIINYCLPEQSGGATRLSILDATGRLIRSFASTGVDGEPSLPARPGLNRFVWDLRYPGPTALPEPRGQTFPVAGPLAVPGAYRVRLEAAGQTFEESFAILRDPRAGDDAGLAAQFDLLLRIRDRISALHEAVARIRALDRQLAGWARRAQRDAARGDEVVAAATTLREHLAAIEGEFIQLRATTIDDGLTVPAKLNVKLALLAWSVAAGYAAPTPAAEALFADLSARLDGHFTELQRAVETEGAAFDDLIRAVALPPIG
ncbi:MAG TPA: hypothetical protein VFL91_01885, partial [Thermomicrobiales bacterium]|nr:hypothetical protein [Thermomicrobiales bacterium]